MYNIIGNWHFPSPIAVCWIYLQACKAHKCSVRIKIAVADNVEKLQPFRCCANLAF